MDARTPKAHSLGRATIVVGTTAALLVAQPGCTSLKSRKEADRVPIRGVIDPEQPRELGKTSMPRYVVEPPDELDVTVKPSIADWNIGSYTVQPDGVIDLGLYGDVYVAGLTLEQVEAKVAEQLMLEALSRGQKPSEPYRVSARISNSQSKYYYVLGTVSTEGRFPIKGNEMVLDAILQAGLKSNSLPEKAYLVRPHPAGGADQVLQIDYCGIKERGETLTNYQLFPGDRIVVPGTRPPSVIATLLGR